MIAVFPFHTADAENAVDLLRWCEQLGGCKAHNALLVADSATPFKQCAEAKKIASRCFAEVRCIANPESTNGWPQGPNSLFHAAAKYIEAAWTQPWINLETDAIPLKPGWLDKLEVEYREHKALFMGDVYNGLHSSTGMPIRALSGVCVYPPDAGTLLKHDPAVPWDMLNREMMLERSHATQLIKHLYGERNLAPTFVESKGSGSPRNAFTLDELRTEAVVFHRNKDGTLISLLRKQYGIRSSPQQLKRGRPDPKPTIATGASVTLRRSAAIGDALCATIVANRLSELGHFVTFQTHPDIHCVIRRCPSVISVQKPMGTAHVDLDNAYEKHPFRKSLHFHEMFFHSANNQLRKMRIDLGKPMNCRPILRLTETDQREAFDKFEKYDRPLVFICPKSDSFAVRTVPDRIWEAAAKNIKGTKLWLGTGPAPNGIIDLGCRHLDNLVSWISQADQFVSVDTGPMHIAAALDVPIVAIGQSSLPEMHLNDQNDFVTVRPPLDCLGCMEHTCPKTRGDPFCQEIDPDLISSTVNQRMRRGLVSAVVAIYKPQSSVLNRCLQALIPQVDEIVVTGEANSNIPFDALKHEKIRYTRSKLSNIGYSGNANHGARHANGDWLLFVNDDCFLHPEAVQRMKEVVRSDVGIVCNLLRYPNGMIYHAGKVRTAGMKGWEHIDYKKKDATFKDITELENCCGCCILTPRRVFYNAGCYDEELPIFTQDDSYALSVRKLGYRILFTPFSEGIHMEHQSVKRLPNIANIINNSNMAFGRKWGKYLEHNANRLPLGNFAY